jgi:hypothetical protein
MEHVDCLAHDTAPRKPRRSADAGLLYPPSQRELAIRGGLAASATTAPRVFGYVRVSTTPRPRKANRSPCRCASLSAGPCSGA